MDFLKVLTDLFVVEFILGVSMIFAMTMGVVYYLGRMVEIIDSWKILNNIAFLCSFIFGFWFVHVFRNRFVGQEYYFMSTLYSLTAVVTYVLLGFRLYDRIDNLLDRKLGKDKSFDRHLKRKKNKTKKR